MISTLILCAGVLLQGISAKKHVGSCMEYKQLLPSGVCMEYLEGNKIAQTKRMAMKADKKMKSIYMQSIPLYALYKGKENKSKSLLEFYLISKCGHKEEYMSIINNITMPRYTTVKKCAGRMKEFLCRVMHPLCQLKEKTTIVTLKPCRKECKNALYSPPCSFLKEMFSKFRKIGESCKRLGKSVKKASRIISCNKYSESTIQNMEYYCKGN